MLFSLYTPFTPCYNLAGLDERGLLLPRPLRIGVLQYEPSYNSKDSAARVEKLLETARVEADMIILPEYANVYPAGVPREELVKLAEELESSPFSRTLERIASEYSAVIISGFYEAAGGCRFSSVVLTRPGGPVEVVYRKNILFDAFNVRESSVLCPGDMKLPLFDVKGVRVSCFVCFELRFPEIARAATLLGAEVIAVPAAWYSGNLKEEHLIVHAKSRAIENGVFIIVSSLVGRHFTGRSMVVSPWGVALLDAGIRPGYYEVEIDVDEVYDARRSLPLLSLSHRAYKLYTSIVSSLKEDLVEGRQQ